MPILTTQTNNGVQETPEQGVDTSQSQAPQLSPVVQQYNASPTANTLAPSVPQQQTTSPTGGTPNTSTQQQPSQSSDTQRGTGFTNLQAIYNANTGNQLGSTIQQGIGGVANQAQQGLGQQTQNFYNQA